MRDLTAKQERVLGIIQRTNRATGQSPTIREMCRETGVASSCTLQRHVEALEKKGFLRRQRYKYRCIQLTELAGVELSYAELSARTERLEIENAELQRELDRMRRAA